MAQFWDKMANRLGAISLLFIGVLGGLLYLRASNKPPNERDLISGFHAHRAAYERLRDMLDADQQVRAVYARAGVETTESGLPRLPSETNFPASRYNEYVSLLKQIGSTEVFRTGDNSDVCNIVWAAGFGGDTRHVQICWVNHEPTNTVANLAEYYQTPKPRHPVFRHIEGNWYLWADW